jgi:hypothetical protein
MMDAERRLLERRLAELGGTTAKAVRASSPD